MYSPRPYLSIYLTGSYPWQFLSIIHPKFEKETRNYRTVKKCHEWVGSTHCVHNSPEVMLEMLGGALKLENVD